jgi:aminoglycoside 6'-N-acetyltransferase
VSGAAYVFQPLTRAHLPLVRYWLSTPHVSAWYGDPDEGLAEIEAVLTDPATQGFIVRFERTPIGYVQAYDPFAEEGHPYRDQPAGTLGIDQFIGKPELLGQGHGPRFIARFMQICFKAGARRIVTDPDPTNARAIRAYAKAGFAPIGERETAWGRVLLMAHECKEPN